MALVPIAKQGNFLHIYDFKVDPDHVEDFIRLFTEFDYGDINPMHSSASLVLDGALVQDVADPTRFWLIGEWADIVEHARIRKVLAEELKPTFIKYIVGGKFVPAYGKVVSATPQHILDKAAAHAR
jgi:quinol monooxygenase YgiN